MEYTDSIISLMDRERRHDEIFELINQGKIAEEIRNITGEEQEEIIHHKRKNKRKISTRHRKERGFRSEQIMHKRLGKFNFVNRIRRYPRLSQDDVEGKDMQVSFYRNELERLLGDEPRFTSCKVQAKSSFKGILKFREQFGETDREIDDSLAEEKIIVLNARWKDRRFNEEFIRQIRYINNFHQGKK